jgi:epoxyqueuosine reductase
MNKQPTVHPAQDLLRHALSIGASMAGIASREALQNSRSYVACGLGPWPQNAESILVLGLAHPADQPRMDWWDGIQGTPGNRILVEIAGNIIEWLRLELGIAARDIPYRMEKGGIFLKDAAVLAGLGVIGRNNLLVTPPFGPRVRLRALFLDRILEPATPLEYAPCAACDAPCLRACPRKAFQGGRYERSLCSRQMDRDVARRKPGSEPAAGEPEKGWIKYCRRCELACPVGWAEGS